MFAQNLVLQYKKHDPVLSDIEMLKKAIQDIQIETKKIQVNIFNVEQENINKIKLLTQQEEERLASELSIKRKSQESQVKFIKRVIDRAFRRQQNESVEDQNDQKIEA